MGAPGDDRVRGPPDAHVEPQSLLPRGAIRQGVGVDLGPQVLAAGEHPDDSGHARRRVGVAVVVRRVLLGPNQCFAQKRDVEAEGDEQQAQHGDVTRGEVPDFVPDHEAQRLGIAGPAADLEHVGVDDHETPVAVTGREGVDLTVAHDHVGVGDPAHAELLGRLDNHPIALRELGGTHLDRGRAELGVQHRAPHPQDDRDEGHQQEELRAAALLTEEEVANLSPQAGRFRHGDQPDHQGDPRQVGQRSRHAGRDQERDLGGVTQRADSPEAVNSRAVEHPGAGGRHGRRRRAEGTGDGGWNMWWHDGNLNDSLLDSSPAPGGSSPVAYQPSGGKRWRSIVPLNVPLERPCGTSCPAGVGSWRNPTPPIATP